MISRLCRALRPLPVVALLLTAALACDAPRSTPTPAAGSAPAPGTAPADPGSAPASAPDAPAEPAASVAAPASSAPSAPTSPTLPPIPPEGAPVDAEANRRARDLNSQALKAHKAESWAEAITLYTGAVQADPGFILARYNLACALARRGDAGAALELLDQLKAAGCEPCRRQLAFAPRDADFATLYNDPRFKAITAAEPPPVEPASTDPASGDDPSGATPADPADPPDDDAPDEEGSAEAVIHRFELPSDQPFGVLAAAVARGVDDEREPLDPADRFSTAESPLTFWMLVRNQTGASVDLTVVWLRDGAEKSRSTLTVRNNPAWRTWALRPLTRWDAGAWAVRVDGPDGEPLHTFPFTVTE